MTGHLFQKWSRRGEVERIIYRVIGKEEFTRADVVRLALEQGGTLSKLQTKSRRAAVDDALMEMRNFKRIEVVRHSAGRGEAHTYRCIEIPETEEEVPLADVPVSLMTKREEMALRITVALIGESRTMATPEGVGLRDFIPDLAVQMAESLLTRLSK